MSSFSGSYSPLPSEPFATAKAKWWCLLGFALTAVNGSVHKGEEVLYVDIQEPAKRILPPPLRMALKIMNI